VVNTQAAAITIAGVTIQPSDIQTVVGTGVSSTTGDGGPASSATLTTPTGIALDAAGNIYIADDGSDVVRVVNTQAAAITIAGVTIQPSDIKTIAGAANVPAYSGDGGLATSSRLNSPYSVALDAAGNVYIADDGNNVIRAINPQATATVTVAGISILAGDINTIAGNGTPGYLGNGGAATSAELNNPVGVFVEANGNILIADANNAVVRLVTTAGTISTFAGDNTLGYAGDGGFATGAELASPHAAVSDAAGDVYIADFVNHRIREVVAGTTKFSSLALGQTVTLPVGLTFNTGLTLQRRHLHVGCRICVRKYLHAQCDLHAFRAGAAMVSADRHRFQWEYLFVRTARHRHSLGHDLHAGDYHHDCRDGHSRLHRRWRPGDLSGNRKTLGIDRR
jgi:hypothetical protein